MGGGGGHWATLNWSEPRLTTWSLTSYSRKMDVNFPSFHISNLRVDSWKFTVWKMWNYWDIWRTCLLITFTFTQRWLMAAVEMKNEKVEKRLKPWLKTKCTRWHNLSQLLEILCMKYGCVVKSIAPNLFINTPPPTLPGLPLVSPASPKSGCFAFCRVNWTPHSYLNVTHISKASAITKNSQDILWWNYKAVHDHGHIEI